VQEHVPGTYDSSPIGETRTVTIEVENLPELVIPAKDPADLVAAVLVHGGTKRSLQLREQHAEPAARWFHDGGRLGLHDVITGVAEMFRRAVDQPANTGMDCVSVTVASDRNANRFRQRLAVEWRGHPPRIARIAGGHHACCEARVCHASRTRTLNRGR